MSGSGSIRAAALYAYNAYVGVVHVNLLLRQNQTDLKSNNPFFSLKGDLFGGLNDGLLSRAEALVDMGKHPGASPPSLQLKHDMMYHPGMPPPHPGQHRNIHQLNSNNNNNNSGSSPSQHKWTQWVGNQCLIWVLTLCLSVSYLRWVTPAWKDWIC